MRNRFRKVNLNVWMPFAVLVNLIELFWLFWHFVYNFDCFDICVDCSDISLQFWLFRHLLWLIWEFNSYNSLRLIWSLKLLIICVGIFWLFWLFWQVITSDFFFFFSFTCRFVDSLQELSADDQKFLTDNRYRYQKTHPLALAKYLLILNWGDRFKVEECLDLMSDWAPMTPLVRSQCHADILLICETRKRK